MEFKVTDAIPLDQYLKLPRPERTWLVKDIIPSGGLVNLFSGPKLGKSFIALDLCRAISQGDTEWCGFNITGQSRVLYIQLDTPRSLWIERFEMLSAAGIDFTTNEVTDDTPSPMHYFRMADMEQAPYPFNVENKDTLAWMWKQLDDYKPGVVVIDTINEVHTRKENDNDDMKLAIAAIVHACRTPTATVVDRPAVLLLSHSRKEGKLEDDRGTTQEGRGATAAPGRYDVILRLQAREGATTAKLHQVGRGAKNDCYHLVKDPTTCLWKRKDDNRKAFKHALAAAMKLEGFATQTDRAKYLHSLCPEKTVAACLMAIRRWP
jgi:RecA-family ATPase